MLSIMHVKKRDSSVALPKRKGTKRGAPAKGKLALDPLVEVATSSRQTQRHLKSAPTDQPAQTPPPELPSHGEMGRTTYYLTREGVVLGPYTEFQILESVRLGIFESHDLAWTDGSTEWLEISRLLLGNRSSERLSLQPLPVAPQAVEGGEKWLEVTTVLPSLRASQKPPPSKRLFIPLTPQQLREHETLFAQSPLTMFMAELTRVEFVHRFGDFRMQMVHGWKRWYQTVLRRWVHPSGHLEQRQEQASC